MSPSALKVTLNMIVTGILLVPTATPHAVQDLQDLKTIIDSASTTINAAPNNSSWGFFNPAAPEGSLGTADLVGNITTTVLRAKYLLDVDKVAWITVPNATNGTSTTVPPPPNPSTTPASNVSLDTPYLDYISSLPTLSTALTKLGRSWHKEMNKPVWDAIDALQQTITTFSTSMLQADLVHSQAIIRTIRASSALEDAQGAWSRLLNLPGTAKAEKRLSSEEKRTLIGAKRPLPASGGHYSHKDLWGREAEIEARQSLEGEDRPDDAVVMREAGSAGRRSRPFIA